MNKRICGILLAAVILAVAVCGCGTAAQGPAAETSGTKSEAEGELSVYAIASDDKVDQYIKDFNTVYKNVKVEKRVFETQEEFDETVRTELSDGTGPDVILFDEKTSLDLFKMARDDVFLALDDKMGIQDGLKEEDYLPGTLESGKVDGVQYILPLTFVVPTVLYNADEETGLEASPVISFEEWAEALEHNLERFQDDPERCASIGGPLYEFVLVSSGALPLYDLEGTAELHEERVRAATEIIKKWSEDAPKIERIVKNYDSDLAARYALFSSMQPDFFNMAWAQLGYHQRVEHEDFAVAAVEPSEEEGLTARVASYGVVTKNAGEFAYEFLRSAMDCAAITNPKKLYGMSLNKNVLEYQIQHYTTSVVTTVTADGAIVYLSGLTPEVSENLRQLIDGITDVKIYHQKILALYRESFEPYLEEDMEFEYCYQEFENSLDLYLAE